MNQFFITFPGSSGHVSSIFVSTSNFFTGHAELPWTLPWTLVAQGFFHRAFRAFQGQSCLFLRMISAGGQHILLLRLDHRVVACGDNSWNQCDIPPLDVGVRYTQVAAGFAHSVLLRSDGDVVACGENHYNQCHVPPLDVGVDYIQVAAGYSHTVYLRSDGRADAFGRNCWGQCRIPRLTPNVTIPTEVSAGACHSVLLRSDGVAWRCCCSRMEQSEGV